MPVHHVPGGKRGAVFAFSSEIDEWLVHQNGAGLETGGQDKDLQTNGVSHAFPGRTSKILGRLRSIFSRPTSRRITLPILSLVLAAVATSVVLHSVHSQTLQVASVQYGVDTLQGKAADGQTLWVHKYPQGLSTNYSGTSTEMPDFRISDFLGDGEKEVAAVVPLRSGPNSSDLDWPQIDFFTGTGKLIWSYRPDRTFRFGDHELKAPWHIEDLLVTEEGGHRALWAVAAHHTWGNGFAVQLDPRAGKDALRFVNTGSLHRVSELKTKYGTYLLFGGFNNEWDGGSLAIMNEARPFAASPQTPSTRHYCNSCPPGMPDYYFVFPRSEINRISGVYENSVFDMLFSEGGIEVRKYERMGIGRENTIYLLSSEPPFDLISLRYDSDYDMTHRAWSAEGKLSHSLENCPERLHPQPVRLWTPAKGWSDVPVKPARADQ
jgi:hypothetical protein